MRYVRKVHFFHVTVHTREGNVSQVQHGLDDDFSLACSKIQAMAVGEKTSKLIDKSESYRLVYFNKKGDYYEGKVAKYRNNHMLTGHTADDILSDLALDEGNEFVEVTHFLYSPQKHILSFEYNQSGPRVTAFTRYINKIQAIGNIDAELFTPELIPHPNVIERLSEVKRIKGLSVSLSADRIPTETTDSNLLQGMKFIRGFSNAGMISVKLSAGTLKRGEGVIDPTRLVSALDNEIDLEVFGKVSVDAITDFGDETINLIDNNMVGIKEWSSPITIENYGRWFDDIANMYRDHAELIEQSLRKGMDEHVK